MMNKSLPVVLAGLLAFLLLSYFCIRSVAPEIEADLTSRSSDALKFRGHKTVAVEADGQILTLSGTVPSEAARNDAAAQVAQIWGVDKVVQNLQVEAPVAKPEVVEPATPAAPVVTINPYNFTMDYNGQYVLLSGFMPSEEARTELLTQLDAQFGPQNVVDQLMIGQGAPEDFLTTINTALLPKMKEFSTVTMHLSNQKLRVKGKVPSNNTGESLTASIVNTINPNYEANIDLSLDQAALQAAADEKSAATAITCQKQFDDLLESNRIQFATGSAEIEVSSYKLLNQLAAIGKQCKNFSITVAGHTDSTGSSETNRVLSQKRAEAVVEYLKAQSVDSDQLEAVGKGESEPRADNATPKGRSENRRIEFIVQE